MPLLVLLQENAAGDLSWFAQPPNPIFVTPSLAFVATVAFVAGHDSTVAISVTSPQPIQIARTLFNNAIFQQPLSAPPPELPPLTWQPWCPDALRPIPSLMTASFAIGRGVIETWAANFPDVVPSVSRRDLSGYAMTEALARYGLDAIPWRSVHPDLFSYPSPIQIAPSYPIQPPTVAAPSLVLSIFPDRLSTPRIDPGWFTTGRSFETNWRPTFADRIQTISTSIATSAYTEALSRYGLDASPWRPIFPDSPARDFERDVDLRNTIAYTPAINRWGLDGYWRPCFPDGLPTAPVLITPPSHTEALSRYGLDAIPWRSAYPDLIPRAYPIQVAPPYPIQPPTVAAPSLVAAVFPDRLALLRVDPGWFATGRSFEANWQPILIDRIQGVSAPVASSSYTEALNRYGLDATPWRPSYPDFAARDFDRDVDLRNAVAYVPTVSRWGLDGYWRPRFPDALPGPLPVITLPAYTEALSRYGLDASPWRPIFPDFPLRDFDRDVDLRTSIAYVSAISRWGLDGSWRGYFVDLIAKIERSNGSVTVAPTFVTPPFPMISIGRIVSPIVGPQSSYVEALNRYGLDAIPWNPNYPDFPGRVTMRAIELLTAYGYTPAIKQWGLDGYWRPAFPDAVYIPMRLPGGIVTADPAGAVHNLIWRSHYPDRIDSRQSPTFFYSTSLVASFYSGGRTVAVHVPDEAPTGVALRISFENIVAGAPAAFDMIPQMRIYHLDAAGAEVTDLPLGAATQYGANPSYFRDWTPPLNGVFMIDIQGVYLAQPVQMAQPITVRPKFDPIGLAVDGVLVSRM